MKKLIIILSYLSFIPVMIFCKNIKKNIPVLADCDRAALKKLYILDLVSSSVEKTENLDLDYYLCTVYDHIKILEHKIHIKKTGWSSRSLVHGFWFAAGGIIGVSISQDGKDTIERFITKSTSLLLLLCSLHCFYRAVFYRQRLMKRLERDKRIFRQLQAEWHYRIE